MKHLYTKHVSDEPLDIIRINECEATVPDLTMRRFRRLWNEYEKLRARVHDAKQYAIEFSTESHPGFVHCVTVTLGEDVMMDSDVVNIDLCNHPAYLARQRYVKANPR